MTPDFTLRDTLTGTYNRAALQERLREETERARRYGLPLSLLLLDLDHYRPIISALGPERGSQILTGLAQLVLGQIRGADVLFRGEDSQFALLLPNTEREQALILARRLIELAAARKFPGEPELAFTLSIGCASFPEGPGAGAEGLYERAGRRLYQAMRKGGGQVVAEDAAVRAPLAFELPAFQDREPAMEALRGFFNELPKKKRGLLNVRGPLGAGQNDFLADIAREAERRDFVTFLVPGGPGLKSRAYGALNEARQTWAGLPDPVEEEAFVTTLRRAAGNRAGLALVLENIGELDPCSEDLLQRVLYSSEIPVVALACACDPDGPRRSPLLEAPFQAEIDLQGFSLPGLGLWLRDVLQWEPPDAFTEWLHRETRGLPGPLRRALAELAETNVLRPTESGWALSPSYRSVRLAERLSEIEARERSRTARLPEPAAPFVGRAAELKAIKLALAAEGPVTVTGPEGVGKTRAAVQAALELCERFPGGTALLPAAGLLQETAALAAAYALGWDDPAAAGDPEAQEEALLLLDGLDEPDKASALVEAIQQGCPRARLLVTAPCPLGLSGEQVIALPPLPAPPAANGEIERFAAVQLFVRAARRVNPAFQLRPDEVPALRRVCELVGGLPLGIELAAGWVSLLPVAELARGIAYFLPERAKTLSAGDPPPGLLAALDCFRGLMSESERRVLRALAALPGGFDWATAARVAGASPFFLDSLADHAVLTRVGERKYAFHGIIRRELTRIS